MKRLLAVSLIALASLVLIPSALSTAPTIVRTSIDDTLVDDVDCGFPVQINIVGTDVGIFFDNSREFHAFPQGRATLTNLVTQRTLTVNIAGPFHFQFFEDDGSATLVGTGPALFFLLFRDTPGITLLDGRFVLSFDAQGNETFSSVGRTRDLCAELAGP